MDLSELFSGNLQLYLLLCLLLGELSNCAGLLEDNYSLGVQINETADKT